jgi:hypothetical protein
MHLKWRMNLISIKKKFKMNNRNLRFPFSPATSDTSLFSCPAFSLLPFRFRESAFPVWL